MRSLLRILAILLIAASVAAQSSPTFAEDRKQAMEFFAANKFEQALPLLEKLAADKPDDIVVQERLGYCILAHSAKLQDPERRKQERLRARAALLKAKDLGDNSNLLQLLLEGIPEDGSTSPFSSHKEAEAAMRAAEGAFTRGDFEEALRGYFQAYLLDPKLYSAPLFAGDVYYKQGKHGSAAEWFAKAIEINPNAETAYRYWGDSLLAQGKTKEAREKFIDAIVADPYTRGPWVGITQWANKAGVTMNRLVIKSPNAVQFTGKGNANITVDSTKLEAKDGSSAWMTYEFSRVAWRSKTFAEKHPGEKYRHTLEEETEALENVAAVAGQQAASDKKVKLDPQLETLLNLKADGLVPCYVLLSAADQETAQDYAAYREKNRDKLRQYLSTYIVPAAP